MEIVVKATPQKEVSSVQCKLLTVHLVALFCSLYTFVVFHFVASLGPVRSVDKRYRGPSSAAIDPCFTRCCQWTCGSMGNGKLGAWDGGYASVDV
jgi:hypothetical protein